MSRVAVTLAGQRRGTAERAAAPATSDDQTVLAGMTRPAIPEDLRAFVAREQTRSRAERELPALARRPDWLA